jgi:hypothetical protein
VSGPDVIPTLGRLRQEDGKFKAGLGHISEFKVSLGYTGRLSQKTKTKCKKTKTTRDSTSLQ